MTATAESLRRWRGAALDQVEDAQVEVAVGNRIRIIRAQHLRNGEVGIARRDVALARGVVGAESAEQRSCLVGALRGALV